MKETTSRPLRIGLKLSNGAAIGAYREVWRIADVARFDHCWAFDHLALDGPNGEGPMVFEGWSLLAAMAAETERVRIGLLVSGLAYRHPALLAKQAVTVDHLSGGRLEFGIGAGWAAFEHRTLGIGATDHAVGRFSEGIDVIVRLWTEDHSDLQGRYFGLHGATLTPRPIQQPRPPIWIGAGGPQMLRLAAKWADVWLPSGGGGLAPALATGMRLRALCGEIGRDDREIRWCAQIDLDGAVPASTIEDLHAWYEAGFTELVLNCSGRDPVGAAELAAERILPAIRRLAAG